MPLVKYRPSGLGRVGGRKGRGEERVSSSPSPSPPPPAASHPWEWLGSREVSLTCCPWRATQSLVHKSVFPTWLLPKWLLSWVLLHGGQSGAATREDTGEAQENQVCPLTGLRSGRWGPVGKHPPVGAADDGSVGEPGLLAFVQEAG